MIDPESGGAVRRDHPLRVGGGRGNIKNTLAGRLRGAQDRNFSPSRVPGSEDRQPPRRDG
jgi:hypothetical protein